METIPDRIYFKDMQSKFVWVNAAQARWLGVATPAAIIGKSDFDFFTPAHASLARQTELEIIRSGRPSIGQVERLEMRDGRVGWGSATKMPWLDSAGRTIGTFGITRDHTETKQIEEKLMQERTLLRTIIDHLPSRVFVKDLAGRYLLNNIAHQKQLGVRSQEEALGFTILHFRNDARGERSMVEDHRVLAGGAPIIDRESSEMQGDGSNRWAITTKVPLRDMRGKRIGLVGISHDITERKRVEQELQHRTQEMEDDLRMACQIQQVFLAQSYPVFPSGVSPEQSALRFAQRYIPTARLGGDFCEVVRISDTACVVLMCDVMGHGVRAGLLTALIRGLVGELDRRAEDPVHVLTEINRGFLPIFQQTGQPVFATVFCAVIDLDLQRLSYANAGHPPPVLQRNDGRCQRLCSDNPEPAAGLVEEFQYTARDCSFQPGDRLICYTDGVIEAASPSGELFGVERMLDIVAGAPGQESSRVLDSIVSAVQTHSGREQFDDDLCLLVIESRIRPAS
jgi:sigma-B regulation protein RsbU (phosphoserine phosphatase)